jgi:WD40 repeat protein
MAAFLSPKEVTIRRLSDRAVHWTTPIPTDMPKTGLGESIHLSDDGNKLVFRWAGTFVVAERLGDGAVNSWRTMIRETGNTFRTGRGTGLALATQLSPDGNTFVGFDEDRGTLRVWDVSRDPGTGPARPGPIHENWWGMNSPTSRRGLVGPGWTIAGADGNGFVVVAAGDRTAEWPVAFRPRFGSAPPKDQPQGPIVIRAKDGTERARILAPENSRYDAAGFAANGRRLIASWASPRPKDPPGVPEAPAGGGAQRPFQETWGLYDTEQMGELKPIASGFGLLYPIANSPFLLELPQGGASPVVTRLTTKRFAIRLADTGEVLKEYAAPPGGRVQITPESFTPTGDRFVLFSTTAAVSPVMSKQGPAPVKVHIIETATGKELGTADLGETRIVLSASHFPDGRRVLIQGNDLRILRTADATTDCTLRPPPTRLTQGIPPPGIDIRRMGDAGVVFSANGRYLAQRGPDSIRVFDTPSGECVQQLSGVVGGVRWAIFNPECTRLFAASAGRSEPTGAPRDPGKFHVWDLSTGRELLTLPIESRSAELVGCKLYLHTGNKQTRILDGTPLPEPAK